MDTIMCLLECTKKKKERRKKTERDYMKRIIN